MPRYGALAGKLDHFHTGWVAGFSPEHTHTGGLEGGAVVVVEFKAVAMALAHLGGAVGCGGEAPGVRRQS